jgi:hypothetical protein
MFFVFRDGLQSAVAISMETGAEGFRRAVEEWGKACGGLAFVMKGENGHTSHDGWLRMIKTGTMNRRNIFGGNNDSKHEGNINY